MSDSAVLASFAAALDALGIAVCAFDAEDATLLWNRRFLEFFPEHEGRIFVGEPYRDNLRRFYEFRLEGEERLKLERYVEEGVARHRAQSRPFVFVHRGRYLRVASLPVESGGRIRIWVDETALHAPAPASASHPVSRPQEAFLGNADAFDHVPDGIAVASAEGRIAWVNQAFVAMYELADCRAAAGQSFVDVYRLAWRRAAADEHERALYEQGLAVLEEHLRFAGAPFEVALPGGRWSRVIEQRLPAGSRVFAHVDISALKRQQRSLEVAEARARDSERKLAEKSALLEATLERMDQGVMMVTPEHVVEVCNRRAIELLGLPAALMQSRPSFEDVLAYQWRTDEFAFTPEDIQAFVRAGGILDKPHSYSRRRPDGRVIEIQSVPIEGGGVLRTYTDVTERTRAEERMQHLARHDTLTSLVNREVFLEHLAAAAGAARFAVHYIDLDHFKPVNDTFGHAAGDKVLAEVAARLRALARDADIVARLGGDEFAVLQRGAERLEHARGLANRVLQSVTRPIAVDDAVVHVGVSIGIALSPADGTDAATLMRRADAAMYAAKASGRNAVRAYSELQPPPPA